MKDFLHFSLCISAAVDLPIDRCPCFVRVINVMEREPSAWGVYLGHPLPGGYKYGDLALQVGVVLNLRQ
jgi:hypothetical protein